MYKGVDITFNYIMFLVYLTSCIPYAHHILVVSGGLSTHRICVLYLVSSISYAYNMCVVSYGIKSVYLGGLQANLTGCLGGQPPQETERYIQCTCF